TAATRKRRPHGRSTITRGAIPGSRSIGLEAWLSDIEAGARAEAEESGFLLGSSDRERRVAAGFGEGIALGANMGEPGKGRQRRLAHDEVIARLAEDLERVRVARRLQRLCKRRKDHRTRGVDVVPAIGKA